MEGQKEMQFQKVEWQAETKTTSYTIYLNFQSMQDQGSLQLGSSAEGMYYQTLMTNLHFSCKP